MAPHTPYSRNNSPLGNRNDTRHISEAHIVHMAQEIARMGEELKVLKKLMLKYFQKLDSAIPFTDFNECPDYQESLLRLQSTLSPSALISFHEDSCWRIVKPSLQAHYRQKAVKKMAHKRLSLNVATQRNRYFTKLIASENELTHDILVQAMSQLKWPCFEGLDEESGEGKMLKCIGEAVNEFNSGLIPKAKISSVAKTKFLQLAEEEEEEEEEDEEEEEEEDEEEEEEDEEEDEEEEEEDEEEDEEEEEEDEEEEEEEEEEDEEEEEEEDEEE